MKRFIFNGLLIICILSVLVLPAFASSTESDDIVILKQPSDVILPYNPNISPTLDLSVVALGSDLSYQWQYSYDLSIWNDVAVPSATSPNLNCSLSPSRYAVYFRCRISSLSDSIYTRSVLIEKEPANILNFVGSCLRYITNYISLIVNSLVTPGAPLYPLLPVLCIGIAVAALLLVIRITKVFSWGA